MMKIRKVHCVPKQAYDVNGNTVDDEIFGPQSSRVPIKRIAVHYAHVSVSQLLLQQQIGFQQKTYGTGIVRICSKTIPQLENTAKVLSSLLESKCVQEIGMPLKYEYKMKCLVLFIKPTTPDATALIASTFEASELHYHITIFDVKTPAEKEKENPKKTQMKKNQEKTVLLTQHHHPKIEQNVANKKDSSIKNVNDDRYHLFYFVITMSYLFYLTHSILNQT